MIQGDQLHSQIVYLHTLARWSLWYSFFKSSLEVRKNSPTYSLGKLENTSRAPQGKSRTLSYHYWHFFTTSFRAIFRAMKVWWWRGQCTFSQTKWVDLPIKKIFGAAKKTKCENFENSLLTPPSSLWFVSMWIYRILWKLTTVTSVVSLMNFRIWKVLMEFLPTFMTLWEGSRLPYFDHRR